VNRTTLLFILLLVIPVHSFGGNLYGMDFNRIDWGKLCPSVKPIELKGCSFVHPTSTLHSKDPSLYYSSKGTTWEEHKPNCKFLEENFNKLIRPSKGVNKWNHCKVAFKASFTNRAIDSNLVKSGKRTNSYYDEDYISWRNRYLKDGFVGK
jgi:hypothetical protein